LIEQRVVTMGMGGTMSPCRAGGAALACGLAFAFTLGLPAAACASPAPQRGAAALADLSLEQLAAIVITSVSRREERLAAAPASIFVISGDDLRRSRVTSLPEALRLAPNLDVARADVNQYAISARGFNNVLANKLLVLIDGRTVYTPLFSGVFWEAQDVLLEDVERIEVISGPGATLWGANAVNGVINIITRAAKDTQGTLATGTLGEHQSGAAVRHGGALGADARYRVYAKYEDRDASRLANTGASTRDASIRGQAGWRADWERPGQRITVQGDAYFGNFEQPALARRISGGNLLGRFSRDLDEGRSLRVQAYVDFTRRDHPRVFRESLDIADVEVQYGSSPWAGHKLLVGGGYRHARDRVTNSPAQAFVPAERSMRWAHVFAQDDIALGERLDLTIGGKIESNVYTGGEFLPNVRLAWRLAPDRLLWGAVSRAVRAPARIDRDFFLPGVPPFALQADARFKSEISNVVEVGYRSQPLAALTYSVTAFHHDHHRLRSYEPEPGRPHWGNRAEGRTYGVEGWAAWRVLPQWRLTAGGVLLRQRLELEPGSLDPGSGIAALGNDPEGWWTLRSTFDVTPRHEFDVFLRHVAARPGPAVPAYTALDAQLGWKVTPGFEVALVVQNAFDPGHAEWGNRAEFERSVFVKVLLRL
jgi:iron complex outermembrane receptor protein